MSRPQVGIERLPTRRLTNEPRESMNCKSCRKRKIKCNRLRPACEACQVFQCACIYDAVPKKRGPKTDVLEALLKRVDGLEQKLKDQKKDGTGDDAGADSSEASAAGTASGSGISPSSDNSPGATAATATTGESSTSASSKTAVPEVIMSEQPKKQSKSKTHESSAPTTVQKDEPELFSSRQAQQEQSPQVQVDALLHTYFTRSHAKPFHILDESSFRQRLQLNQIPSYLLGSVCALASRYTPHPNGYQAAVRLGEEYALRARAEIDVDEPSIDCLQTLLLLALAFVASGKGKKAYMLLSNAIGMAVALELHREMDSNARIMPVEREMRRRLFWTCYLLDRFMACGSRRPSLIHDSTILLRLPSWLSSTTQMPVDGDFFQTASNMQYIQNGGGKRLQGGNGMLIDISRILGITNRYLAAGGVKGDSHFPWHSLSNLSKIRQDLDIWATGAQDIFSSIETLFSQPDATVLVMSKLIYHLIHCLIYRPFLPVDLAELSGTGQHQSWQIEATNMCFLHANAIAELTELGKQMPQVEWPGFVGYCICTAGTVHIHGAHYNKNSAGSEMGIFATSAEFLSREMQHMAEMRHAWACVQHHRQTLQKIYNAHTELIKATANSAMRYSPVFQLEDFFDRYTNIGGPGGPSFSFDATNLVLADVIVDFAPDAYAGHNLYTSNMGFRDTADGLGSNNTNGGTNTVSDNSMDVIMSDRQTLKRRKTVPAIVLPNGGAANAMAGGNNIQTPHGMQTPSLQQSAFSGAPFSAHSSSTLIPSPGTMSPPLGHQNTSINERMLGNDSQSSLGDMSNFSLGAQMNLQRQNQTQQQQPLQQQPLPSASPFSPSYNFSSLAGSATVTNTGSTTIPGAGRNIGQGGLGQGANHVELSGYDPMFATMPTNAFSSPSPWTVDDTNASGKAPGGQLLQHSPDGRSNDGSAGGTVVGEEKDPFLSLLEQLADNEYARGPGNELDFFLAGTTGSV
ncbi:hypothetical protein SEUCBS139899_007246 [Sporothrix eucalyptigena]|uniref:Zn(2)-C6 fungal-type domain-containing protein n=1 Tax=Sporothrix eucalyptigena TaxID=1812306 RepID=A0ABP0B6T2_9PEZI